MALLPGLAAAVWWAATATPATDSWQNPESCCVTPSAPPRSGMALFVFIGTGAAVFFSNPKTSVFSELTLLAPLSPPRRPACPPGRLLHKTACLCLQSN